MPKRELPQVPSPAVHEMPRVNHGAPGRRFGPLAAVVLILAAVSLAAMGPALVAGRIPAETGLIDFYWPWMRHQSGPPPRLIGGDSFLQFLPDRLQAARAWLSGELPLWDPWTSCGMPLLGGQSAQPLDPFIALYLFLPVGLAQGLELAALLFLAGLGLVLFLRQQGVTAAPALLVGAVAFALNPYFAAWLELRVFLAGLALAPLALWALEALVRGPSPKRHGGVLALAVGFSAVAGTLFTLALLLGPLALRLVWLTIAPWRTSTIVSSPSSIGRGGLAVAWIGTGLALGALPLLAAIELYGVSTRHGTGLAYYATSNFLHWRALGLWFDPTLLGWPPDSPFLGEALFHRTLRGSSGWGAAGVVPLGLALLGLASGATPRRERWFWGALAGTVLLGLIGGTRLFYSGLQRLWPGIDNVDLLRLLFLENLAMCVLAAWGVQALCAIWAEPSNRGRRWLLPLLGYAAAAGALVVAARAGLATGHGPWRGLLWPLGLISGVGLLGGVAQLHPRARAASAWGLGVLVAFELGTGHFRFNAFAPGDTLYPVHPAITWLQQKLGPPMYSRFLVPGSHRGFPPNLPALYGLSDVRGYANLPIARYRALLEAAEGKPSANHTILFGVDSPVYRLLGANHVFFLEIPGGENRFFVRDSIPGFSPKVFRRRDPLPRAFLVHEAETLPEAELRTRLADPAFDPSRRVYLESATGPPPALRPAVGPEWVQIMEYRPTRIKIRTLVSAPALLLLTDVYYPGWEVTVDGRSARILPADLALRGVPCPAGTHLVEFTYRPAWLVPGTILSGLALLGVVLALGTSTGWRSRGRTPREGTERQA